MAQKDLDLRTIFARVKLKNTDKNRHEGDSSFDTTDIAYLHSVEEVKNIPIEKRRKSLSDFALSNFAWQSNSYTAENGKNTGVVLLRSVSDGSTFFYAGKNNNRALRGIFYAGKKGVFLCRQEQG